MPEPYDWIRRLDLRSIGAQLQPGTKPREHGTQRGYSQHQYRHEKPCDECRAAHYRYNQQSAAS